MKEKGVRLLVGDHVRVGEITACKGVIEDVLPRKNSLARPPVANVDLALAVFSVMDPPLALTLLDRIILTVEGSGLEVSICLTKIDLPGDLDRFTLIADAYRACGYKVFLTGKKMDQGFQEIRGILRGKVSVLAGPSGVGKTTLVNRLKPDLNLLSSPISKKSRRGRQTTRDSSLIKLGEDTFIVDTPGFQRLDLKGFTPWNLSDFFPEMRALKGLCRFAGCLHAYEPGCAVKEALEQGKIASWRYDHYQVFLEEIKQKGFIHQRGKRND